MQKIERDCFSVANVGPYIYMTLAFLALLGAPYIYDISSLRVKRTVLCVRLDNFICQREQTLIIIFKTHGRFTKNPIVNGVLLKGTSARYYKRRYLHCATPTEQWKNSLKAGKLVVSFQAQLLCYRSSSARKSWAMEPSGSQSRSERCVA